MKVVDLIRRDRRSLEYCESGVSEDSLVRLAAGPVLPSHVAVIGRGSSPGEPVAMVIGARSMEAVAAGKFAFEMINTGELDIRHCRLVVIAILVEPRNRVGAIATVGGFVILRNRRRAGRWGRICMKQNPRQ